MNKAEKRQVAEEFNKDAYFYYLREPANRTIFGGVYLKKVGDVWCRGISLLSDKDKFDKVSARKYARRRLVHAIQAKCNDYVVNPEAHESSYKLREHNRDIFDFQSDETGFTRAYKSRYDAKLTEAERNIVKSSL